jgi:hypothetical protein
MYAREEENLRFISTTHRTALDQRRHYEWQTVVTTLTLYVLTVATVYAGNFQLPKSGHTTCFALILPFLLWFVTCIFLGHIHRENATNKEFAETAERDIINTFSNKAVWAALPSVRSDSRRKWSLYWQCAIIFLFALVSALLLLNAPNLPVKCVP